ncbi:MAG: TatD family hydrolase [Fimbriimonadales bacterium]|nr:TatD family hydrolase [Fimbriimonadales bacterium]
MRLFDTHCHLNLADAFPDPAEAIEAAYEAGVSRLLVVGIDVETSRRALEIADRWEGVYAAVGLHPTEAPRWNRAAARELCELARHPKAIAWGEIGLDYHWMTSPAEVQRECLLEQLHLASDLELPAVLHCRDAHADLLRLLESLDEPPPLLLHCFSGGPDDARRAVALGALLGFDGPLTYRRNRDLRELVASLPRERVVLETDSPYLAPEPHRGKQNRPSLLPLINQTLAALWRVDPGESAARTTANAERFFGLA